MELQEIWRVYQDLGNCRSGDKIEINRCGYESEKCWRIWASERYFWSYRKLIPTFQLLQKSGHLNQVPVNSQLLLDIKYRLIYIFQYHKDFYHLAEDYLEVLDLEIFLIWIFIQYLSLKFITCCNNWYLGHVMCYWWK